MFYKRFLSYIKMSECNSIECNWLTADLTDSKKTDMILHRAKYYYENIIIKRDWGVKQEINTETYLKQKKIKRENMQKIGTTICLKKKRQRLKEYKKNYREAKNFLYNNE